MKLNINYLSFFIIINFSNSQIVDKNNVEENNINPSGRVYIMDDLGNFSMNINVWGAVSTPGRLVVTEGVNLITVLSMVGGARVGVDYSNIILLRDIENIDEQKKIIIDMTSFLENGDKTNLIKILPNDTIIFKQKKLYFILDRLAELTTTMSIVTFVFNLLN